MKEDRVQEVVQEKNSIESLLGKTIQLHFFFFLNLNLGFSATRK